MKTIKEYREIILKNRQNPGLLASLNIEMSADYAYYAEMYGVWELKRSAFFIEKKYSKEKPLSDEACKAFWQLQPDGEQWRIVKQRMKGLEKMQKSINNLNYVANNEAKGAY